MSERAWRRTWLQVHGWIGLGLAVLLVPLCLSGAALVWQGALDRLVNPARYAQTGRAVLAASRYVAGARGTLGAGEHVASLTWPSGRGPVRVTALADAGAEPPARVDVYLDPRTARVIERASSARGPIHLLRILHGELLVPGWGRALVGLVGVALALCCLSGLWLWWPVAGEPRGESPRRRRPAAAGIHRHVGFWSAWPLLMLSVTGALLALPASGGRQPRSAAARPLDRPAQDVDAVVARAATLAGTRATAVSWPTTRSPDWTVAFGAVRTVKVADDAGTAVAAPGRAPGTAGPLLRRLHDGAGMGWVWQAVIVATGVLPTLLAITGVMMWRERRRRIATDPI